MLSSIIKKSKIIKKKRTRSDDTFLRWLIFVAETN